MNHSVVHIGKTWLPYLLALVVWGQARTANADEPWLVPVEADIALPLTSPQTDWFNPGGSLAVGVYRPLTHWLVPGLRLRGGLLLDANANTTLRDNGNGTWLTLSAALRLRPFSASAAARRAVGPWIEIAGGGGLTGEDLRPAFEAGLGWGFALGAIGVSPTVRYMQVVEASDTLDSRDARLLLAGLEVTFFDTRSSEKVHEEATDAAPSDRDGDGIVDPQDQCPDDPEDQDAFQDDDGCPDPDNDQDKILDGKDRCPMDAEDRDGFEDDDGCPELDNDGDGLADIDDQCPNERETVNGINDHDGCPDEGLIELIADRVVLEERVLFDLNRSRVKSGARPVLDAIVHLWKQHPEWTELRIEGHSDQRGKASFNQRLSERRATNVRRELVRRGIPSKIIQAEGFGATRLRDTGTTEQAHQRNRRVEFVVVNGAEGQPPANTTNSENPAPTDKRRTSP